MLFSAMVDVYVRASSGDEAAEKVLEFCHSGEVMELMEQYGLLDPTLQDYSVYIVKE